MTDIVIVGSSGHARVVIDIVEKEGRHRIVGLLDDCVENGTQCYGYRVMGTTAAELPRMLTAGVAGVLIAVGDNWTRSIIVERCRELVPTIEFVTAVHPSAQIARGAVIGAGSVVMAGAVINSNATVGRHCIVNTNVALDHDSVMDDYSCLLPGATVAGNVRIGEFVTVAMGATIVHGVTIGAHAVVGAGATVLRDVPPRVVTYGTPARVIRERNPGDRYL